MKIIEDIKLKDIIFIIKDNKLIEETVSSIKLRNNRIVINDIHSFEAAEKETYYYRGRILLNKEDVNLYMKDILLKQVSNTIKNMERTNKKLQSLNSFLELTRRQISDLDGSN